MTTWDGGRHMTRLLVLSLALGALAACERPLSAQQDELRGALGDAREDIVETRQELVQLERELTQTRAESQSVRLQAEIAERAGVALTDNTEGAAALRARADELERRAAGLLERNAELTQSLSQTRVRLGEVLDQVQGAERERVALLTELEGTRTEVAERDVQLQEAVIVGEAQLDAVITERDAAQAEAEVLRTRETQLSEQSERLREQLASTEELMTQANVELTRLSDAQRDLTQQLQGTRNEMAALPTQEEVNALLEEREASLGDLETLRTQLNERPTQAQLTAAREEAASLRAQLRDRPTPEVVGALETQVATLQGERDRRPTQADLDAVQVRADELEERLQARPTQAQLNEAQARIQTLELQLQAFETEIGPRPVVRTTTQRVGVAAQEGEQDPTQDPTEQEVGQPDEGEGQ